MSAQSQAAITALTGEQASLREDAQRWHRSGVKHTQALAAEMAHLAEATQQLDSLRKGQAGSIAEVQAGVAAQREEALERTRELAEQIALLQQDSHEVNGCVPAAPSVARPASCVPAPIVVTVQGRSDGGLCTEVLKPRRCPGAVAFTRDFSDSCSSCAESCRCSAGVKGYCLTKAVFRHVPGGMRHATTRKDSGVYAETHWIKCSKRCTPLSSASAQ